MEKIIVIGAGPAGLAAAINAKNKNNEVIILEANEKIGKKLLITGAGKCNYLNDDFTKEHFRSNNLNKISNIFDKEKIKKFYNELGIVPVIKNGYYYPYSQTSISVQNAYLLALKSKNIEVIYNEKVKNIIINNGYLIITENNTYRADKVVLATGGCTYPKTGSNGSGYKLLSNLNMDIVKPLPALTSLKISGNFMRDWAGIRCPAEINLMINSKIVKTETGEIQLTDYGVSGICIMQLSGMAIKALENKDNVKLKINFLPEIENYKKFISERKERFKDRDIIELLEGLINYKLLYALKKIGDIEKLITNLEVEVIGYNDFDKAQVTQGGLNLDMISNNFETNYKGLYVVGELLDVDGDCGGYNVGFATLSGIIAGSDIFDKSKTN